MFCPLLPWFGTPNSVGDGNLHYAHAPAMAITKQTGIGFAVLLMVTAMASWSLYMGKDMENRLRELENSAGPTNKRSGERSEGADSGRLAMQSPPRPAGGAVYVRWGRTVCPADNELVYAGSVAGSWFDHQGGAPNYICMPRDPQWGKYTDGASGAAYLYGGEYEAVHVPAVANHNPPCAVCRVANRSSAYMLPGRLRCHEGWTTEYFGYLVSGHFGHKHGYDYVCLDDEPEADPAGYRDENGALMYKVEAQCGSLPCPEYVNNREVTCAVCSK